MNTAKHFLIFCLAASFLLAARPSSASLNRETYWEFETTEKWKAIYGKISGLADLNKGDSVGVFDTEDNCYGAGFFDGDFYYLSAFEKDTGTKGDGDSAVTDDYEIPGFDQGDEVIFKVYVEAEGAPYTLKTLDGRPYFYTLDVSVEDMYPPKRIDLAYAPDTPDTPDTPVTPPVEEPTPTPPDADDGSGTTILSGGLPYVRPAAESTEEPTKPGATPVVKKEPADKKAPRAPVRRKVTPPDYYPKASTASRARKARQVAAAPEKPVEKKIPYKTYEPPVVKKRPPKITEFKMKPVTGWPLWLRLLLLLLLLLSLYFTARKLMREMQKKERENAEK
jgi:hypothetical protein